MFLDLPDPSGLLELGITPPKCRGFGISPDAQHICGTFIDPRTGDANWWTAVPSSPNQMNLWTYERGLVQGSGGSARAINDQGDIVGFHGDAVLAQPMFGPGGGAAAADFAFSAADTGLDGMIYGIDNAQNMVGTIRLKKINTLYPEYPEATPIGFKVNAQSPSAHNNPQLIEDLWVVGHPHGTELRGINAQGDVVGNLGNGKGFVLLNPGTVNETPLDVSAVPWLAALNSPDVAISGINSSRTFVGWHITQGVQHGLVGKIDAANNILALIEVDHPGGPGTQLFGISEGGWIIGTFENNIPFLCIEVFDPAPRDREAPTLDELKGYSAFIEMVRATVGAGVRGQAVDRLAR
jgi:hypothetical protein